MSRRTSIVTDIARADADDGGRTGRIGLATVHEAMGRIGLRRRRASARSSRAPRIAGTRGHGAHARPATTSWSTPRSSRPQAGDVIVVVPADRLAVRVLRRADGHRRCRCAACAGYVTTGGVRDTAELRAMGFPVWTRARQRAGHGEGHRRIGQRAGRARRRRRAPRATSSSPTTTASRSCRASAPREALAAARARAAKEAANRAPLRGGRDLDWTSTTCAACSPSSACAM